MPVRRALVYCAVLSLQDTCFYYPSCDGCFSRINIHPTDTARCFKCGRSYLKEQVNYRYRLSLSVVKNTHIFGVTVFGSCLNPFFGIPATALQRLVEEEEEKHGGHSQATLLINAVKDCFVGRHFVFGIKVTDSDQLFSPHFSPHPYPLGPNQEARNFIASQITLPCAAVAGCSVVSYYRSLLQQALVNVDSCVTSRPPPSPLLLVPSTPNSFNTTLPSCLCSPAQCDNNSLTPTPPWQQSLGVITSSAEQDEGWSFEGDGGELTGRQRHGQNQGTSFWLDSIGEKEHSEDRVSPPTSTCCPDDISWGGDSFWKLLPSHTASPESPVHRSSTHTTATTHTWPTPSVPVHRSSTHTTATTHTWPTPSVPVHSGNQPTNNGVRECLDEEHAEERNRSLSDSLAWEDLPFSESLGEFVCEAAGQLDRVCEKEPNATTENGARISISSRCSDPKKSSNDSHDSTFSTSCDRALQDITNAALLIKTPNVIYFGRQTCRGLDLTERVFPVKAVSPELIGERRQDGEQQLGSHGDEYNCSADLFDCSQIGTDANTKFGPDNLDLSVSVNGALNVSECFQSPNFVPFSQSTPMGKRPRSVEVPFPRGSSHAHATRTHTNDKQESKTDSGRHMPKAHSRTPWTLEPRQYVLAQQCQRVHQATPKGQSNSRMRRRRVCDSGQSTFDIDTEIPPTCKVLRSVRLRPESNSSCEGALQDRAEANQQYRSGLKQRLIENYDVTGCDNLACSERKGSHERTDTEPGLSLFDSSLHEQSGACDLSRDLFANSF